MDLLVLFPLPAVLSVSLPEFLTVYLMVLPEFPTVYLMVLPESPMVYLMVLLGLCLLCAACAMRSLGSPLTAPLTPHRPGNPDLLIRFPLWCQKARGFFAGRHT